MASTATFIDEQQEMLAISIPTQLELLIGCRNRAELPRVEEFVERFERRSLSATIGETAVEQDEGNAVAGRDPGYASLRSASGASPPFTNTRSQARFHGIEPHAATLEPEVVRHECLRKCNRQPIWLALAILYHVTARRDRSTRAGSRSRVAS